jgi:hypothetical protein
MEPLVIPDDLSALSDEELELLAKDVRERLEALNDEEKLAELGSEAVTLIENAMAADDTISAEETKRDEAAAEQAQILAETRARLAERLNPPEPDEEPAADDDEPETEPVADAEPEPDATPATEPEPVLAAAKRQPLRRSAAHEPKDAKGVPAGVKLMALAAQPGEFDGGATITRRQAAAMISDKWNRMHNTAPGPREDVPLIRYSVDIPEDRMLYDGDDSGNMQKLDAVVGPEALVASGGLCAPVEPYYDLQLLATEATPVIDSLPLFGADRGGIRFMAPPTLANISTAVGIMTAANDAIGGTTATKTCQTLPCPAQTQVLIDAVYHCLTIGNMGARSWPELVDNFMSLTMAAHARVRETKAIDAIKNGSTAVTGAQYNGAVNTLLAEVNAITDGFRSRHRMDPNARFRAWFPEWVKGLLLTDLERGQFNRFDRDRNGVVELLRNAGVEPTFFIDGETGGGQVFGTQGAGAYLNYPATVKWYIAPEGTWIRLNGGELDLGIVRDSVLNATNDFQAFGEVFENYAKIGIESLAVTSTVCANGVVSAPAAPSGC